MRYIPTPTRPWIKLAKHSLESDEKEEVELMYVEIQKQGQGLKLGQVQEQGRGQISMRKQGDRDSIRNYTSQSLRQIIQQPPSTLCTTFDTKTSFSCRGFSSPFSPFEAISPITSPDYSSAFVTKGKAIAILDNDLISQEFSVDESIDDIRVLSDEIVATLPFPMAVMFPFSSNPMNENEADSVDDGKMCQYINTMATSIVADTLKSRQKKMICTLEPSPLELLVRMPPEGFVRPYPLPVCTNIYSYSY